MRDTEFHKQAIGGIRSMWDTFYWMDAALQRHIHEFEERPGALHAIAAANDGKDSADTLDLIARLTQLRTDAEKLKRDLSQRKWLLAWPLESRAGYDELTDAEKAGLARMDAHLNRVGEQIRDVAADIDAALSGPLQDDADRLNDRNLDIRISFHLREDDPAWRDDEDDTVAMVERNSADCMPAQWPDGYDPTCPMPHGGVFHALRLYGGYEMGKVDYRDILRIGRVWVDVAVTCQYLYDLAAGKWVKCFEDGPDGGRKPVFVREEEGTSGERRGGPAR